MDLGTHPEALPPRPLAHRCSSAAAAHRHLPQPGYLALCHGILGDRARADNGAVLDAGLESLVRGAALNLSHMENFELATGANWLDDGDYLAPVNSQRQL